MSEKLPKGTVTYLFTDVEEHSRLWQAYPQAMPLALAEHDAMLETAVRKHHGHVVKNTGDGIFAVFATAYEAIGAAIDAQLALVVFSWDDTGPLRVRMAAHTGEAHIRDGDYFGTAVIRAARIMSLAAGGQILLSGTTARLLHDHLPREISLISLGQHRLKGLQRPAQLFQLQHPALPAEFPDLKSLDRVPNNLPLQVTSFIGREREITDLSLLLSGGDDRAHWLGLITLTGTGGTGKTRLSLEVAADHLEHYPDGVWLLELAALTEDAQVAQALASVLKLGEPRSIGLLDLLTSYLRSRKVLIIVDNCEHLIGACALLCDHLLRSCPELQLLATSREALGISGETIYSLPPLELPEAETVATEDLLRSDAGQLFIERATAAKPHIQISYDDALAIAQICHRLDGIPLAIELAAARVNVFTPQQIERRLGDRFRLLTGGSRAALPRQQTLSALVDWSYQLLSKDEKELLRRVSVFRGGWTFEAAEAIWGDSLDIIQLLPHLINKSMVSVDEDVEVQRYRLLETIRRFAQNKLSDHNEMRETRNDHLAYYDRLASVDSPQTTDILDVQWLNRCQQELDNYRAALAWAVEQDPDAALRISGNLS